MTNKRDTSKSNRYMKYKFLYNFGTIGLNTKTKWKKCEIIISHKMVEGINFEAATLHLRSKKMRRVKR